MKKRDFTAIIIPLIMLFGCGENKTDNTATVPLKTAETNTTTSAVTEQSTTATVKSSNTTTANTTLTVTVESPTSVTPSGIFSPTFRLVVVLISSSMIVSVSINR